MELVFVYGTLLQSRIQTEAWGKPMRGVLDILPHHAKYFIFHRKEHYPVAVPEMGTDLPGKRVSLTLSELRRLDRYESKIYERRMVFLKSGVKAWAYLL